MKESLNKTSFTHGPNKEKLYVQPMSPQKSWRSKTVLAVLVLLYSLSVIYGDSIFFLEK